MIYVLEVYSYVSNKKRQLVFSENSIKLNKFIDLAVEYHIDWNFVVEHFVNFVQVGVLMIGQMILKVYF